MSNFKDGYSQDWNPEEENRHWFEAMSSTCPNLAEAIRGEPGWKPGSPKRPPYTLMIFAKDGKIKMSLSSVHSKRRFFAEIQNPGLLQDDVESILAAGKGEWVTKRE